MNKEDITEIAIRSPGDVVRSVNVRSKHLWNLLLSHPFVEKRESVGQGLPVPRYIVYASGEFDRGQGVELARGVMDGDGWQPVRVIAAGGGAVKGEEILYARVFGIPTPAEVLIQSIIDTRFLDAA